MHGMVKESRFPDDADGAFSKRQLQSSFGFGLQRFWVRKTRIRGQNHHSEQGCSYEPATVCGCARRNEHVRHATHMMLSERPPKLNGNDDFFLEYIVS
jgi:hypothetical protein